MRRAKSYSIIDHELLHGKYLHSLSHEAMALYLFLIVVSDREGKSFYGEKTILQILRLTQLQFKKALNELITFKLIDHRSPYFWINNLERKENNQNGRRQINSRNQIPQGCAKTFISPDRGRSWDTPKESIQALLRQFNIDHKKR